MKTIGFHSYKGGTGKSLMAANLAVCLSRLGNHCVLVDCDVEGPSVHNKFLRAGKGAIGRGGFIGLVASHFGDGAWATSRVDDIDPAPVQEIDQFLYELPAPWEQRTEGQRSDAGTIRLLPAGDIHGPDYWKVVWSPLWHELFTVYHRYSLGQVSVERYRELLDFFLGIKSKIASLTPKPDYMIVDFRAGASELSTTLINAWIDTLVYAFGFNEDSIDYLANTFAKIWQAGHDQHLLGISETPFDIELVLSRVPTGINYRGDRVLWNALRAMRVGWDDIHVLHSDRDLEMWEEVRTGFQAAPQNRRLTQDYMKLFEAVIRPDDCPDEGLATGIGLPQDLEETDRIFTWESERGALINPNDGSRNVSFKVETFQTLLRGLEEGLSDLLREDQDERFAHDAAARQAMETSWLREALHSAGRRCGTAFGDALADGWRGKHDLGIEEKLRRWCEFDSDVGFGKFQLDPDTIEIKGRRLIKCDVLLLESYLTPAKDTSFNDWGNHRYCSLQEGYVQAVISRILGYEVEVAHEVVNPIVIDGDGGEFRSESCQFTVSIAKPADESDSRSSVIRNMDTFNQT